jgi:hypothetical protein
VTPGKIVSGIRPKLECDRGRAVLRRLEALDLDRENIAASHGRRQKLQ